MILPDVLKPDLKIVFCGTAASRISAAVGAYYANPTNYFWRTLYSAGFIGEPLSAAEFQRLAEFGYGLTDLARQVSGNDVDLERADFDTVALREKMVHYQPRMLAFTSKRGGSAFLERPTGKIIYGLQAERIGETQLWVLPSPSGSARRYWDETIWRDLAQYVQG